MPQMRSLAVLEVPEASREPCRNLKPKPPSSRDRVPEAPKACRADATMPPGGLWLPTTS